MGEVVGVLVDIALVFISSKEESKTKGEEAKVCWLISLVVAPPPSRPRHRATRPLSSPSGKHLLNVSLERVRDARPLFALRLTSPQRLISPSVARLESDPEPSRRRQERTLVNQFTPFSLKISECSVL